MNLNDIKSGLMVACATIALNAHASMVILDFNDLETGPLDPNYMKFQWGGTWEQDNGSVIATSDSVSISYPGWAFKFEMADFSPVGQSTTLTLQAYRGGALIQTDTLILTGLTEEFKPNFANEFIDKVVILSTDGDWRLDNFHDVGIAVPEPTTIVAGALLLLPFGFSTLRKLRRNRVA